MYIAGYRLAMLVGGAGSLWIASYLGVETYKQSVWMIVYISMGALMFVGILTTLLSSEPKVKRNNTSKSKQHTRFFTSYIIFNNSFIFFYSFLEKPFSVLKTFFKNFLFAAVRICLCFLLMSFIILLFIKTKFLSKDSFENIFKSNN